MENENKIDTTKEIKTNIGNSPNVLFIFDTTSSMLPCIQQVRQKLRDLVKSMVVDIPDLKIGLIAHGDYCDGDNCIAVLDLTNDIEKIMNFINNTPNTGGGDAPECYEFALQTAKNLSWPKEGGSVVLIGDDEPHEENPNNIKWREECKQLLEKNIKVFPMQCLYMNNSYRSNVNKFWEEISGIFETPLIMLESFGDSTNTLEAIAYASSGKYDTYKMKFDDEVTKGIRCCTSANLFSNQSKLDSYTKNIKN